MEYGYEGFSLEAEAAHDAVGSTVPTTLTLTGSRHRHLGRPLPGREPRDRTAPPPPAPACAVPSLRGLGLRAAKSRLRADHCGVGKAHAGTPVAVKLAPRHRDRAR